MPHPANAKLVTLSVGPCSSGGDLSLPAIVRKMVGSGGSWDAVVSFCEQTMSQKEAVEREREITTDLPLRSRRTGRRRRADNGRHERRTWGSPSLVQTWARGGGASCPTRAPHNEYFVSGGDSITPPSTRRARNTTTLRAGTAGVAEA